MAEGKNNHAEMAKNQVLSKGERPMKITVNIEFPNQRAYDVAWGIVKLHDYKDLDDFINYSFLKILEMYPEGTAGLDLEVEDWGFKSRWQIRREKEEEVKEKQQQQQQEEKRLEIGR